MAIEHVRVSQQAKEQLLKLKRNTGIKNWNVLCRWAFCMSLADSSAPKDSQIATDSSVEMTWKVFGGQYQDLYFALLKERCEKDGLGSSDEILINQFKLHLHRGIAYIESLIYRLSDWICLIEQYFCRHEIILLSAQ
jgi:DNA sulfur modification protein DndE